MVKFVVFGVFNFSLVLSGEATRLALGLLWNLRSLGGPNVPSLPALGDMRARAFPDWVGIFVGKSVQLLKT